MVNVLDPNILYKIVRRLLTSRDIKQLLQNVLNFAFNSNDVTLVLMKKAESCGDHFPIRESDSD